MYKRQADRLDKEGKLPRISGALLADAVGTSVGAALGVSTTTTFVESASGVTEGGRTGLTLSCLLYTSGIFSICMPSRALWFSLTSEGFCRTLLKAFAEAFCFLNRFIIRPFQAKRFCSANERQVPCRGLARCV